MRTKPRLPTALPRFHQFCHSTVILLAGLGWLAATGWAAEPLSKGHMVLDADFEAAPADAAWIGGRYEAGFESPRSLCVDNRTGAGAGTIHVGLPAETLRGCTLRGSAMVKADGVSAKPNSWNGIKFMLAIETPDRKLWPQAALDTGTFDWTRAVVMISSARWITRSQNRDSRISFQAMPSLWMKSARLSPPRPLPFPAKKRTSFPARTEPARWLLPSTE